jgi:tetratricopeptide (TPR) repeat protein
MGNLDGRMERVGMKKNNVKHNSGALDNGNVGAGNENAVVENESGAVEGEKTSHANRRLTSVERFKESNDCANRGEMDQAILHALHSLEGATQRPRHYEHLARLLCEARMPTAGEAIARRAIELGFDQPFIHLQLGRALFARKSYLEAMETLDSAIERGVDDIKLRRYRDTIAKRLQGMPLGDSLAKAS